MLLLLRFLLQLHTLITWHDVFSRMTWPVLLYHLTWFIWLFLLFKDVLKPFPTPWHVDLSIAGTGRASVCCSMCLHQSSRDVTFANSSRCVNGDATRVPRYSNKHAQSLWIPPTIFRHSSE